VFPGGERRRQRAEGQHQRLVPRADDQGDAQRIVFRPYDPRQAYAEWKTAAVMLAVEATRRWSADGIYANAVNPGAIATGLQKHTGGLKTPAERRKSVEQGAATPVFLAASPLAEGTGGRYFEDVNEAGTLTESPGMFGTGVADYALEPRYAELLWEVSAEIVARDEITSTL